MSSTLRALSLLLALTSTTLSAPLDPRLSLSAYAPVAATCPSTPLVRAASGLSSDEAAYIAARKPLADAALQAWLSKTSSDFNTSSALPTLGLASSGGGYRALLVGAGMIQALDDRDSTAGTAGLYQALTYHAGLSGGAWLASSLAGNNWPTVSSLQSSLWAPAFQDSALDPDFLLAGAAYAEVLDDILAKNAAGFPPTLVDLYGRLLSYQLLDGSDGGVATTLSGVTALGNFTAHAAPFPLILSVGVDAWAGACLPTANATTYEFSPYEFGSWDAGVAAFTPTHYLGTAMSGGKPNMTTCTTNYDNLGYILGTSSDIWNNLCLAVPSPTNATSPLAAALADMLDAAHEVTFRDEFATYPNPFLSSSTSPLISAQPELYLADGGEAGQEDAVWPFVQSARSVDVLLVSDSSGDTDENWPNGSELLAAYTQAQAVGLDKMPYIPPVETILAEGLNERPVFFGCTTPTTLTLVWLPNADYTFASNVSTAQIEYSAAETASMIANGAEVASMGGNATCPVCLGCGIMAKANTTLPGECADCLAEFCYGWGG